MRPPTRGVWNLLFSNRSELDYILEAAYRAWSYLGHFMDPNDLFHKSKDELLDSIMTHPTFVTARYPHES